jgi:hypothetical protein
MLSKDGDDGQVLRFTTAELKATFEELVRPIEKRAYEAGKLAGLAEANELVRLEAMLKTAHQAGFVPPSSDVAVGKTPEELAKRAHQIQVDALRDGKELSNIESVKLAYREAELTCN